MSKGILFDSRKCIGCEACCEACKTEHHLSGEFNPADLGADTFTVVKKYDDIFVRKLCRHCVSPACASSCPVGALHKLPDGPVVYDASKCIGCRYCFVACPYGIPRYQWNSTRPQVRKCDFCADRLKKGQPTACAEVCPRHATIFGEREELLERGARKDQAKRGPIFSAHFRRAGSRRQFNPDDREQGFGQARDQNPRNHQTSARSYRAGNESRAASGACHRHGPARALVEFQAQAGGGGSRAKG